MRPELKKRILRVADSVRVFRHYQDLVKEMASFSNVWNSTSAQIQKGMETGDVDAISMAIRENRKGAESLSYVLRRHERVVEKLGDK